MTNEQNKSPPIHTDAAYIPAARERFQREGELEIDDNATVSHGEDPGAYVQAWVWVPDTEIAKARGQA
jgi:hypothetical protein